MNTSLVIHVSGNPNYSRIVVLWVLYLYVLYTFVQVKSFLGILPLLQTL